MSAYNKNLSKNEIRRLKSYLDFLHQQQLKYIQDMENAGESYDRAVRLEREYYSKGLDRKMHELELRLESIDDEVARRRANGEEIKDEVVKRVKEPIEEELQKYRFTMFDHDALARTFVKAPRFSESLRKYREVTDQIQYFEQLLYHDIDSPTRDFTQFASFKQQITPGYIQKIDQRQPFQQLYQQYQQYVQQQQQPPVTLVQHSNQPILEIEDDSSGDEANLSVSAPRPPPPSQETDVEYEDLLDSEDNFSDDDDEIIG